MKGKNPNVRQKRILDGCGFNPDFYLVLRDTPIPGGINELHVSDRENGELHIVRYYRDNPFSNAEVLK